MATVTVLLDPGPTGVGAASDPKRATPRSSSTTSEDQTMTRQEKQALIQRLHDIWSTGDTRSIHEVYAENFVAHMPKGWGAVPSRDGHDGIRRAIERLRVGLPDWREDAFGDVILHKQEDVDISTHHHPLS